MPLPHNPFAAESYEEPIPYELTDEGIHAAAEAEALREAAAAEHEAWAAEAQRLAEVALAEQAAAEAAEAAAAQTEPATTETPDEGTVDDDVTEQGDADRQAAVSDTDNGAESVSDGADSHDVGPVTPETVPAEQEGDVDVPPAAVPQTGDELKAAAKAKGIKGTAHMNKAELRAVLGIEEPIDAR